MILQELYRLYERLLASGAEGVPQMGTSMQNVSFCIELTPEGGYVFRDLRCAEITKDKKGKTKVEMRPIKMAVLGSDKGTGPGTNPCFLSDRVDYLLGCIADKSGKMKALKYFNETKKRYLSQRSAGLGDEYEALCRFYERWERERPENWEDLPCDRNTREAMMPPNRGVFRMQGKREYLHEIDELRHWWISHGDEQWFGNPKQEAEVPMMCLITGKVITGEEERIARLHEPLIAGVGKEKAKLVSFNKSAFCSYGKEQGANSPVSERAAFGYCTALNYLLRPKSSQRVRMGDETTVFWTDKPGLESYIFWSFSENPPSQDKALSKEIRDKMIAIATGHSVEIPPESHGVHYFLLGVIPGKGRLSIRFFLTGTMDDFIFRMREHHAALCLQRRFETDPELIVPWHILHATVRVAAKNSKNAPEVQKKAKLSPNAEDKIPATYIEPLMHAIFMGRPYPDSLAVAMLRRFKADRDINYIRCAYLKAWLTRKNPSYKLTPMLDENNTQVGYVLGRLFALMNKTQEDATRYSGGKLDRTIRDAYYASASTTPAHVFPPLFRLYTHHRAKMPEGLKINREKEMLSVTDLLKEIPSHLNTEQQGLFALGFYHQTQALFTKKTNSDNQ